MIEGFKHRKENNTWKSIQGRQSIYLCHGLKIHYQRVQYWTLDGLQWLCSSPPYWTLILFSAPCSSKRERSTKMGRPDMMSHPITNTKPILSGRVKRFLHGVDGRQKHHFLHVDSPRRQNRKYTGCQGRIRLL